MRIEELIVKVTERDNIASRLSEKEVQTVLEVARWALGISHENLFSTALKLDKRAERREDAVAFQVVAELGTVVDNHDQSVKHLENIGKSPENITDEANFLLRSAIAARKLRLDQMGVWASNPTAIPDDARLKLGDMTGLCANIVHEVCKTHMPSPRYEIVVLTPQVPSLS